MLVWVVANVHFKFAVVDKGLKHKMQNKLYVAINKEQQQTIKNKRSNGLKAHTR